MFIKLMRLKLMSKAQKQIEIKTLADNKLKSIKNLNYKALYEGQIPEQDLKIFFRN